jgi:hypothetical protein
MRFETLIINSSSKAWTLYDAGQAVTRLQPGQRETLVSDRATTALARYERIEKSDDGAVDLEIRKDWADPPTPPGYRAVMMKNTDGAEVEDRLFPGLPQIYLQRGLPLQVAVPIASPLARIESMEIVRTDHWTPRPDFKDYWHRHVQLRDVWTERSPEELKKLAEERDEPLPHGFNPKDFYPKPPVNQPGAQPPTMLGGVRLRSGASGPQPLCLPDPELPPVPEVVYSTELVNKTAVLRDGMKPEEVPLLTVLENGKPLLHLKPGESVTVHSASPLSTYARFSTVVWKKDGEVDVVLNKDWTPPDSWKGRYLIEILNRDGAAQEGLRVSDESVTAVKGVPRLVPISVDDANVFYSRMVKVAETTEQPDPDRPGYLTPKTRIFWQKEKRPAAEIREISDRIRAAATDSAVSAVHFPKDIREDLI